MIQHPRMTWLAILSAGLLAVPTPAHAQGGWFESYRTFSLYIENDALAFWKGDASTDERYTQGLRLTWEFAKWPEWAGAAHQRLSLLSLVNPSRFKPAHNACDPQLERADLACGSVSFGLGQTIYSPVDVITPALQPRDQPFAGWLFGTIGLNVRDGRWQSTTEVVLGVVGPASLARDTQSLAHWTWAQGAAKPGGWDNQLHGSLHGGLMQTYAVHWFEKCLVAEDTCSGGANEERVMDFSPRAELVATTTMVRGSLGAVFRAGRGFPDFLAQRIPATALPAKSQAPTKWWWNVFGAADQRWVVHNAFISGSYADGGVDGWRTRREIEAGRRVNELSGGGSVGNGAFSLTFQAVSRSPEWAPFGMRVADLRRHSYLSLAVALNQGR